MRQESLGRPFRRANTTTAQAPINRTEERAVSVQVIHLPQWARFPDKPWIVSLNGREARGYETENLAKAAALKLLEWVKVEG